MRTAFATRLDKVNQDLLAFIERKETQRAI